MLGQSEEAAAAEAAPLGPQPSAGPASISCSISLRTNLSKICRPISMAAGPTCDHFKCGMWGASAAAGDAARALQHLIEEQLALHV